MGRIIEAVAQKAEGGDLAAAKLLWQYGMGRPAQPVQPDRMDLEELALYQEQQLSPEAWVQRRGPPGRGPPEQLSPEAWVQIIKSIPAGMAYQMLRPIMPVLNRSAAKGIQQLARQSGIDISKAAPSISEHNGQHAPMETGDIGERKPSANRGNGERGDVVSKPSQDDSRHGHASVTMAPIPKRRERARRTVPSGRPGPTRQAPLVTGLTGRRPR